MKLWQKNLYSLWLAQLIAALGLSMIIPFLPFYLRDLGVSGREAVKIWSGFIYSAPFMISAFMQPVWGMLGDRKGRKPMVVRAMLALSLANFLMGFARSAPQLLILRFLQGSLSGFVAPSLALMASSAPEEKTGQALGTLQSSLVTGMVGGPLLGGVLAHFVGYRPLFFGTALFCLIGATIVIYFVKEDFVRQEKKDRSSLSQNLGFVLHSSELRGLLGLLVLVQLSTVIVAPFLSLFVEYLNVSPTRVGLMAGIVFGITGMTNAAFAPFWGKKSDKVGSRKILRRSLIGITLFSLPQAFVTNIYQLLILRGGLGVFFSGVIPTINTIVRRSTPPNNQGGIFGIFQSGLLLGNMAGPLIGGILAASFGIRSIFIISTCIYCIALLWQIFINSKTS
ncbi:MAG: MFS transporter [Deltaproteobacteria bacterium]|nr:MFS transporter [Deltaproteobacteria bacterium]